MSLSGFGIRVTLASNNKFGGIPSLIFWKNLCRIGIISLLNAWLLSTNEATWTWSFFVGWFLTTNLLLFRCLVMSNSSWPHGLQHARLPCPSLSPGVCSNSCPLSQWCHPTISSSVIPFSSCLQSFPASGAFQMSQFFTSGGQSIGVSASASVLPMNIQDWFPLELTDLISLQSKGLSRVFSSTTVRRHEFLGAQSFLLSSSHIRTTEKNHSFDYTDLCRQSNVSTF